VDFDLGLLRKPLNLVKGVVPNLCVDLICKSRVFLLIYHSTCKVFQMTLKIQYIKVYQIFFQNSLQNTDNV